MRLMAKIHKKTKLISFIFRLTEIKFVKMINTWNIPNDPRHNGRIVCRKYRLSQKYDPLYWNITSNI